MANLFKKLVGLLTGAGQQWWLEIKTAEPACTYYFGPFEIEQEAQLQQQGYIDDLQQEGSKVLSAKAVALDGPPQQLTVYEEGMDDQAPGPTPAFSGQS
ncbi:DUF1816 domain-containing protein [Leptolyngbya iicbica]|uniref:DUF1816 domain-containing protein n=2 Tax=Cyanophyceae TaxID=3028117 RepID=A0A4Q7E482_9CYAN|nr:DUF1816 domain-containing protein [Leptolyngbya sp. LK]RZM74842.1 DUF1816 domain-containing protein [Leptolyngbya sp. LK]